jgi:hypothetical protein
MGQRAPAALTTKWIGMRDVKCAVVGPAGPVWQANAGLWRNANQIRTGPPLALTPASGALGQARDGDEQDRAQC